MVQRNELKRLGRFCFCGSFQLLGWSSMMLYTHRVNPWGHPHQIVSQSDTYELKRLAVLCHGSLICLGGQAWCCIRTGSTFEGTPHRFPSSLICFRRVSSRGSRKKSSSGSKKVNCRKSTSEICTTFPSSEDPSSGELMFETHSLRALQVKRKVMFSGETHPDDVCIDDESNQSGEINKGRRRMRRYIARRREHDILVRWPSWAIIRCRRDLREGRK